MKTFSDRELIFFSQTFHGALDSEDQGGKQRRRRRPPSFARLSLRHGEGLIELMWVAESPPPVTKREIIFKKKSPTDAVAKIKEYWRNQKEPAAKDTTLDKEKKERVYIFRKWTPHQLSIDADVISKESLRCRSRNCSKANRTHPKYICWDIFRAPGYMLINNNYKRNEI